MSINQEEVTNALIVAFQNEDLRKVLVSSLSEDLYKRLEGSLSEDLHRRLKGSLKEEFSGLEKKLSSLESDLADFKDDVNISRMAQQFHFGSGAKGSAFGLDRERQEAPGFIASLYDRLSQYDQG